jgi:hypothetical protein
MAGQKVAGPLLQFRSWRVRLRVRRVRVRGVRIALSLAVWRRTFSQIMKHVVSQAIALALYGSVVGRLIVTGLKGAARGRYALKLAITEDQAAKLRAWKTRSGGALSYLSEEPVRPFAAAFLILLVALMVIQIAMPSAELANSLAVYAFSLLALGVLAQIFLAPRSMAKIRVAAQFAWKWIDQLRKRRISVEVVTTA